MDLDHAEQGLTILHETIATAKGSGQAVDLVFRDISWVFDKVWHDGLKYKIRQRLPRLPIQDYNVVT